MDEGHSQLTEGTDWVATLQEILMRAADGEISDDDTAFVVSHLPVIGDNLQEWLQNATDNLGQEKIQIILMLILIYKMRT